MACSESISVVVLTDPYQVLLHKREDFRIWSLPGGFLEPGESWEQAAVREVEEETGYRITVERFVGEYWQPQMHHRGEIKYVCTGRVAGGEPIRRGSETVAVSWFDVRRLPFSLSRFMREHIRDARAEHEGPINKTQRMPACQALAISWLLKLRDGRNWLLKRK